MSGYHVLDILFDFSSCNAFNASLIDKKTLHFDILKFFISIPICKNVSVLVCSIKRECQAISNIDYQNLYL